MDTNNPSSLPLETKYQKLAQEYTKLRSQAAVLKKAFLAEQGKTSSLRETLRQKETQLRKSEQETDSLNFRNKQMERRIIALQEDFSKESSKKQSNKEKVKILTHQQNSVEPDPLLFEELQKKIIENAQLTSVIDDKNRELDIQANRLEELEKKLEQQRTEQSDLEKKLRKEIDNLTSRNSEMETKLVDAGSILGSEDTLSVAGSEVNHVNATVSAHHTPEERISNLEKDVVHWRTQYELLKMKTSAKPRPSDNSISSNSNATWSSSSCSTAATGISVTPCDTNNKQHCSEPIASDEDLSNEQVLFNKFSNTFESLLKEKCVADSKATSFQQECEGLQIYLEQYKSDLECKELELQNAGRNIQILEEDLTTTRLNYEEQISVLTEQVISLSDQLAASK